MHSRKLGDFERDVYAANEDQRLNVSLDDVELIDELTPNPEQRLLALEEAGLLTIEITTNQHIRLHITITEDNT